MSLYNYIAMRFTPLYHAIIGKHEDAIRLLIESGADINKRYSETDCPIVWYACWNNKDMIRLLVELGLDVNSCNDHIISRIILSDGTHVKDILRANGATIDIEKDYLKCSQGINMLGSFSIRFHQS